MGTRMVSLRVDEELLEWATGFARERGVSRTGVFELALRSLREDAGGGVPELVRYEGVEIVEDARVPRPIMVAPEQRPARSEQSRLAMERMRRMDPGRYG